MSRFEKILGRVVLTIFILFMLECMIIVLDGATGLHLYHWLHQ